MATEPKSQTPMCPTVEAWLESMGAEYVLMTVKMSDIDLPTSYGNQARLGQPLLDDKVLEYKRAMARGESFPPPVLYETKKGFVTVDGNNRIAALLQRNRRTTAAYIVTNATPELIKLLTYTANVRHGVPLSATSRALHAVELVELGWTQKQVAEMLNVSESAIANAVGVHRADARAAAVKSIPRRQWQKLAPTARRRLGEVRTDEGFVALAKALVGLEVGSDDVSQLVTEVNKVTSGAGQAELVAGLAATDEWGPLFTQPQKPSSNGSTRQKRTASDRIREALVLIERTDLDEAAASANLSGDVDFSYRCADAARRLAALSKRTKLVGVPSGSG